MTTINNPTVDQLQAGDTVFMTHPKIVGEVGVTFDGDVLDFPNEQGTPAEALGLGFTFTRAERVDRSTITIKGRMTRRDGSNFGTPDTLVVVAVLPSGKEKPLYQNGIGVGERTATITLDDFQG